MTTWYILSPIDQICLHCPLPRCNENDPCCPYHLARAASNVSQRKPGPRETQVLNYLRERPKQHRTKDIALAIDAPYQSILHVLRRLQGKGQATTTGKGRTRRWTAKPSP